MSPLAPPDLIIGAPRLPLPFGLFSVFSMRPAGDRWETGVAWESLSCAPAAGFGEPFCETDEAQSVTIGGAGLTSFTLTFSGQTTTALLATATALDVQAALIALSNIGPGEVAVTGAAGGPYTVVFQGALAQSNQPQMTATPTGGTGTVTVATTVAGAGTLGEPLDLTGATDALGTNGLASPFSVYGHFRCSPVGWTPETAQSRATDHLLAREEHRVEQAFWSGDLGNVPSLAPLAVNLTGAAVSASVALGMLEDYIATNYGSLGVIHMRRSAAVALFGLGLLVAANGRLTTGLGTPVVAGSGYVGDGPGAVAQPVAGTAWAYVSPALFGYRSEVFASSNRSGDNFNRSTNDLFAVAQRTYEIGFDPCGVAGALLTLP